MRKYFLRKISKQIKVEDDCFLETVGTTAKIGGVEGQNPHL